jgi:hypothetical protein
MIILTTFSYRDIHVDDIMLKVKTKSVKSAKLNKYKISTAQRKVKEMIQILIYEHKSKIK